MENFEMDVTENKSEDTEVICDETTTGVKEEQKIDSIKTLVKKVAVRMLEELDPKLADCVDKDNKISSAFSDFQGMTFLMNEFKDKNPTKLKTATGIEFSLPVSINHGARYKEIVNAIRNKVGPAAYAIIVAEAAGTHLEQFAKEYNEQVNITDLAEKQVVGHYKRAFKHWLQLMSQHYEANYNVMVEGSDMNSELRIVGLWNLNQNKEIESEFYVNPDFIADEVNAGVKRQAVSAVKANKLSEKMGAIKGSEVLGRVAVGIKCSVDMMPTILSSNRDMLKAFSNIKKLPASKKAVATVHGNIDTKHNVEEI